MVCEIGRGECIFPPAFFRPPPDPNPDPKMNKYSAEQTAVIESPSRQLCVIAGAGSGKTHTLVGRILADIENRGLNPAKIVVITFTNQAARELKERLKIRLGFVGTLHSWCLRLLNLHGASLGYTGRVSMIDEATELALMEKALQQLGTDKTKTPISQVRLWKCSTSLAKREAIVASIYRKLLMAGNATDFDLVLSQVATLVSAGLVPPIHGLYVDEYQDSGPWDSLIYLGIRAEIKMLVGDPDQSIYEFRGGRLENILEITSRPHWTTLYLSDNYRSGVEIVDAANAVVSHNEKRLHKRMAARKTEPACITIQAAHKTPSAEAAHIAAEIREAVDRGLYAPHEHAVLVRYNAQIPDLVAALQGQDLPVTIREEKEHPWLSLAVSALNALDNPENEVATVLWCEHIAKARHLPAIPTASEALSLLGIQGQPWGKALHSMHLPPEALQEITAIWAEEQALDLIPTLLSKEVAGDQVPGVFVGTIHAAKGLEWECVYLAGMHAAGMPGKKTGQELEQERRLFYVGITRARTYLDVTHTDKTKKAHGPGLDPAKGPSPFIAEMRVMESSSAD